MGFPKPFYSIPDWSIFVQPGEESAFKIAKDKYIAHEYLKYKYVNTGVWNKEYITSPYVQQFKKDHFLCHQCDKPVDKFFVDDNVAKCTLTFEFRCHGEICAITLAPEVLEDAKYGGDSLDKILYFIGPIFSNPTLKIQAFDLVYQLHALTGTAKESEAIKRLEFLAMNSREVLNIVKKEYTKYAKMPVKKALSRIITSVEGPPSTNPCGEVYLTEYKTIDWKLKW